MAKVKIQGHASGTGVLTVTAPNTSTDSTITLPNSTGTLLDENSSLPAANLTGTVADARLNATGAVLKENLLTNSGFDVWSRSTLGNVGSAVGAETCASDLTGTGWTGYYPPTFDTDHYSFTRNQGSAALAYKTLYASHTVGKLYRMTVQVKDGTATSEGFLVGLDNGSNNTRYTTTSSWVTYSHVYEATTSSMAFWIGTTADPAGNTILFKDIQIFEVTPGCWDNDDKAFDGWHKRGSTDVCRQHNDSTYTKDGSYYSLKVTSSTSAWVTAYPSSNLFNDEVFLSKFQGRTVTFGAWVYSTLATPEVRLSIADGSAENSSSPAQNTWTWLEVTKTISTSAAYLYFQFTKSATTAETFYISQPMVVFGSSIGEGNYTRPQGEIVYFENSIQVEPADAPSSSTTSMNLESLSSGVIPKGAKAITGYMNARNSAVEKWLQLTDEASGNGVIMYSQVANLRVAESFTIPCDTNGDVVLHAEDGNWSGLDLYVNAVELR